MAPIMINDETRQTMVPGVRALRPAGEPPIIFWIHYMNFDITRFLGTDHPLYSVTLTRSDIVRLTKQNTFEAIAGCIAHKISAALPEGPCIVGGFSLGGLLAYEAASQLRRQGRDISLLIMIEPLGAGTPPEVSRARHVIVYGKYLARRVGALGFRGSARRAFDRMPRVVFKVLRHHHRLRYLPPGHSLIQAAVRQYRPTAYSGYVQLVLASERHPSSRSLSSWEALVPTGLSVSYVDCFHLDVAGPPHAQQGASAINQRLSGLQSRYDRAVGTLNETESAIEGC